MTTIERRTRETQVTVSIATDTESATVDTTVSFLDHMIRTLARYSGIPLTVKARGDLRHHIVEDVAICVGEFVAALAPNAAARFGDRAIPMDDALVHCALDLGGRAYYEGPLPSTLYDHWMRSFSDHARCTLHLRVLRGADRHHVIEAAFKCLGLALRDALAARADGEDAVFSTKGAVSLRRA
jgi:imidazoleglycerol-phosphate dehydratase